MNTPTTPYGRDTSAHTSFLVEGGRATGQTPRAASKQLDAENCVSVEALANLVRHSDEVLREFLTIAGREDVLMTQDERERRTREAIRILTGRAE